MHTLTILDKIEAASGKAKIQLLKAYQNDSDLAQLLDAALNYKRRFYIKKFELSSPQPYSNASDKQPAFLELLKQLESRHITGHAALQAVEQFLATCNELEQKWYARVIRKDLRAGFGAESAVKAGFDIPVFDVQLAKPGEDCKRLDEMLKEGCWVSRKVDGYRCIAVIENGNVELLTRSGQLFENFSSIETSLAKMFEGQSIVLDGEIMSDSFNAMQQSAFASTRGTTVGDVAYHLFDIVSYDEWTSDKFVTPYKQRLAQLENLFTVEVELLNREIPSNIRLLQHEAVSTKADIFLLTSQYISEGYEGLMLKPNVPYYRGKISNRMLKFKEMKSWDCEVLSVYEGEGRNLGRMGGVVVMQENGVNCDVGSGWTDHQRIVFWDNPTAIIGRIIECQYQELTDDQKMRFPTFQRFRDLGPNLGKI
jgi:DNA ligase 1